MGFPEYLLAFLMLAAIWPICSLVALDVFDDGTKASRFLVVMAPFLFILFALVFPIVLVWGVFDDVTGTTHEHTDTDDL